MAVALRHIRGEVRNRNKVLGYRLLIVQEFFLARVKLFFKISSRCVTAAGLARIQVSDTGADQKKSSCYEYHSQCCQRNSPYQLVLSKQTYL